MRKTKSILRLFLLSWSIFLGLNSYSYHAPEVSQAPIQQIYAYSGLIDGGLSGVYLSVGDTASVITVPTAAVKTPSFANKIVDYISDYVPSRKNSISYTAEASDDVLITADRLPSNFEINKVDEFVAPNRVAQAADGLPQYTFRGDPRPPQQVFSQGIPAKGTGDDLLLHTIDSNNPMSKYISTSKSFDQATTFATNSRTSDGLVYVLKPQNGIDVNKVLGPQSPFPFELEIAIPNRILPSNIRGVTPLNGDGSFKGFSVLNPNYLP